MKLIHTLILLSAVAAGPVHNAFSAELLQLSPYSAYTEGGATFSDGFGPHAGLELPDGASSSFAMGFVLPLPPEYAAGQDIRVGIAWHTDAATPCDASLRPNFISVARFGKSHIIGSGASTGLAPENGTSTITASETNVTYLKVYEITPPDGATTLVPGDVINFGLFRPTNATEDDCAGDLVIQHAAVLLGS